MGKYQYTYSGSSEKTAKAQGTHIRVHFKNVVEVAAAIKGMKLSRAKEYLQHVLEKKEAIPVTLSKGARGRHAQGKNTKTPGSLVFWPTNAVKYVKDLLKNAEASAVSKHLKVDDLYVAHSQCNQAPKGRRRTYRAHGRIGPYMRQPAHVQIVLKQKTTRVAKPKDTKKVPRVFRRKIAATFRVKQAATATGTTA